MEGMRKKKIWLLCPGLILLAVWPCAVHMDTVRTGLEDAAWYPSLAVQSDFFMHIRSVLLLILAVWMAGCVAADCLLDKKQKWGRELLGLFWPLLGYEILVILSGLFSSYRRFSFQGMAEQYETVWTLMAYGMTVFYFYYMTRFRKGGDWFLGSFLTGAAIQCIIGFSQLAGVDFWSSPAGKWLVLLGTKGGSGYSSVFAQEASGQVYLSFYHPNYGAVYLVLVLPVVLAALFFARKIWQKVLLGILAAAVLVCLWGTGSKTAFLVCIVLALLGGILWLRAAGSKRSKILFLGGCGGALAILCLAGLLFPGMLPARQILENAFPEKEEYHLDEVTLGESAVKVVWDGDAYFLSMEEEEGKTYFSVQSGEGDYLPLDYDSQTERFSLTGGKNSELAFEGYTQDGAYWIVMYQGEIPWYFTKYPEDASWSYINLYQKSDVPVNAPYVFGEGYENALSGRMYLWSRSIPLLKNYILLGSGPDTFPFIFPQNDYVARANIGLDMLMPVISKAHSFYLQTALQTGILSLGLLLIFFVRFFRQGWKVLKRGEGKRKSREREGRELERKTRMALWALMVSAAGFLLMGVTNDSVVAVSPLFWALLGMGFSWTRLLSKA